jgi:hypothetical protein
MKTVTDARRAAVRTAARNPARFGNRARLVGVFMLLVTLFWIPRIAPAQSCGAFFDLTYMGPLCAVEGKLYTVGVALSSGTISGGSMNVLTINRFRFELDCADFPFVGCTDEGDIIR